MFQKLILVALTAVAGGCAGASTIPLAADTIQITADAAPICGAAGVQNVAIRRAAAETIRRGYDRFVVIGGQYQARDFVAGYTPIVANSTGAVTYTGYGNVGTAYGHSTTVASGGAPIVMTKHNQGLTVKMFKDGDPAGVNAISARDTLGPKWREAIASNAMTCLGE